MNPDFHHKALPKGDRLHWYRIESILGQGGFGITYLAEDTNLEQRVAIKEYLPNELAVRVDDTTVQPISEDHDKMYRWGLDRFLKEAKTLARFKHPNIVRVQSFFEQNNTAYMVMEYEEGQSLAQLIKTGKLRGEKALRALLDPILDGLGKVHEAGFIHRDIKPDNIFIRSDGSPVLLDFGSARHAMSGHTRTLTSLVTPGYAPFEQYHDGEGKQGPWTDVYGMGATVYRAIAGKAPIEAIKRVMARANHATDPYLPLADLKAGEYSEHFLDAIDCALRFNGEDRPQTALSWLGMLHGTEPVPPEPERLAPPPQPPDTGAAPTVAQPTLPQTGGADEIIDLGDPQTFGPQQADTARTAVLTEPEPPPAAQPAKAAATPRRNGLWIGVAASVALIAGAVALWFVQRQPETALLEPAQPVAQVPPAVPGATAQPIDELLRAAKDATNAGRLTAPEGQSALDYYRRVLQLDATNPKAQRSIATLLELHITAANRAINERDLTTARTQIRGAERINAQALEVRLAKEKLAAAETRIRNEARVVTLLGEADRLVGEQRFAEAIARFQSVQKLDPNNLAADTGIRGAKQGQAKMRAALERKEKETRIAKLLSEGDRLLGKQDFGAAAAAYRQVTDLDGSNAQAQAGIQAAEQKIAEDERAQRVEALLGEARQLSADGEYQDAIGRFREVLALDSANAAAASGIESTERKLQAREKQQRAVALLNEAAAFVAANDFEKAINRYEQALALDPGDGAAAKGMQNAKAQLRARQSAQAQDQRAQRVEKSLTEGERQLKAKRYARAQDAFQAALKLDADNQRAKDGLARAEKSLAAVQLQQRIDRLLAQGQQHLKARRWSKAEDAYRSALQLDSANDAARSGLASVQRAKTEANARQPYTLAILPWTLRGTDNYEQSIFGGLQQALQARGKGVRLTHSHYRDFDAARGTRQLTASGISRSDLNQVWVKQQGLFSEATLSEKGARAIAKRLGVDAVLLARVSIAAETASIDLHFFDQRNGKSKTASGEFHFPVWGYHAESAARIKALVLEVLPSRI